jgi:hypothetical protein
MVHVVSMGVFEFIEALIQYIADRQFKMIRYYGAYDRKWKPKFRSYLGERITQSKLCDFPKKCEVKCPVCGSVMELAMYWKTGPPINMILEGTLMIGDMYQVLLMLCRHC